MVLEQLPITVTLILAAGYVIFLSRQEYFNQNTTNEVIKESLFWGLWIFIPYTLYLIYTADTNALTNDKRMLFSSIGTLGLALAIFMTQPLMKKYNKIFFDKYYAEHQQNEIKKNQKFSRITLVYIAAFLITIAILIVIKDFIPVPKIQIADIAYILVLIIFIKKALPNQYQEYLNVKVVAALIIFLSVATILTLILTAIFLSPI